MFYDLSQILSASENKLVKGMATFVLASVLSACGAGGGETGSEESVTTPTSPTSVYEDDPTQPETAIAGRAVKGTIINGVVRAYQVVRRNGEYVFDDRPYRNAVATDSNGGYNIRFKGRISNATFMVSITANENTRMICDVVDGCLDADGNLTDFGSSFPLSPDFQLLGIISGVDGGDVISAHLTPLTHMAVNYAMALDGGLSASNILNAKRHVESMLALDVNALDQAPVDVARLAQMGANVTKSQLESSIISAAFLGLVNTPQWNDIADVLIHVSDKMIETGSLNTASSGLDQDISLEDLFYEASSIAQDLIDSGTATGLTATLTQVRSETHSAYEAAAAEGEPSVAPVVITAHPQSVTVTEGANAQFSVAATGGGTLAYQWRRNGVNLSGQTAASLNLSSVSLASAGTYDVVISNSEGSETSLAALLVVNQAPVVIAPVSITSHPTSQTVIEGANVQFSVTATGGGTLSYQWLRNGNNLSGQTGTTLSLSNVSGTQAGNYSVRVTNSEGSVVSQTAVLTVNPPPVVVTPVSVTSQPVNTTVDEGSNAQFSVGVSGSGPISFQWYRGQNAIAGATSSSLSLSNVETGDAGNYRVLVSNSANTVYSNYASLTVNALPPVEITSHVQSQTVTEGASVQFSVTATGSGTLTYQWSRNGATINGATSRTYNIAAAQVANAGTYSVRVSNGRTEATSSASLTVNALAPVTITASPQSQSVLEGANVQFSVTATGGGTLSYQWSRNGTAINGATSRTYSIAAAQVANAGTYSVRVSNGNTEASASATLTVTALTPVAITSGPSSQLVMVGNFVEFSVTATGSGTLSYQWSRNGTPINGATSRTYSIASAQLSDIGTYSVRVSNSNSEATSSASLNVEAPVVEADIVLSWSMPEQREDGSALSEDEISGYVIAWGVSAGALSETLEVSGADTLSAVLEGLDLGVYYFAIATIDSNGMQGGFSDVISVNAL